MINVWNCNGSKSLRYHILRETFFLARSYRLGQAPLWNSIILLAPLPLLGLFFVFVFVHYRGWESMSWDTGDVCMYIDTRDVLGRLGILEELYLINLSIGNFQSKGTKSEGGSSFRQQTS